MSDHLKGLRGYAEEMEAIQSEFGKRESTLRTQLAAAQDNNREAEARYQACYAELCKVQEGTAEAQERVGELERSLSLRKRIAAIADSAQQRASAAEAQLAQSAARISELEQKIAIGPTNTLDDISFREELRSAVIVVTLKDNETLAAQEQVMREVITQLNVCEACDGSGELEHPCLQCGGEDAYCQHTPDTMECPCCDGSKVRSKDAAAALSTPAPVALAKVQAGALREAADDSIDIAGGISHGMSPARWLRDRAAALEAQASAPQEEK